MGDPVRMTTAFQGVNAAMRAPAAAGAAASG